MHFKNGREAKPGDHVITKSYTGNIVAGQIFDINANGGKCNCSVAVLQPGGVYNLTCQDVGNMVHVEDAFASADAYNNLRDFCQQKGFDITATNERVA